MTKRWRYVTLVGMKIWAMALVLVLVVAGAAAAHPGMTDRYDGHKCFKKCEDWGILYGEYHLHDKDRNPVRIKKPPRLHRLDEPVFIPEAVEGGANTPVAVPVAAAPKVIVVQEQNILPVNPWLLLLLALLILLLILRMDRRRKEQEADR